MLLRSNIAEQAGFGGAPVINNKTNGSTKSRLT
jgi:hypothetical protein